MKKERFKYSQALEVEGLEDELDVLDRLEGLYNKLGMTQESMEIKQKISEKQKQNNNYPQKWKKVVTSTRNTPQVKSTKVGRNDPCRCGSGRKFKKCCG